MSTATLARQIGLEERNDGLSLTKNSLTRSLRADTTRRIASSSSSDAVTVTSACVVPYHPTPDSPTYVLCALSDGTLCVINTTNLAKTYFFDDETETERTEQSTKEPSGTDATAAALMSVACVCIGDRTSSLQQVVAYVSFDGWIRSAALNVPDAAEMKKLHRGKWSKVLALPDSVRNPQQAHVTFAVSPFSSKLVVHVLERPSLSQCSTTAMASAAHFSMANSSHSYVTVLSPSTDDTTPPCAPWVSLSAPHVSKSVPQHWNSLCTLCWFTENTLLCLWSNGIVAVLNAHNMTCQAHTALFAHSFSSRIQVASVAVSKKGNAALIAVVVEETVLLTYTVLLEEVENRGCGQKRPRTDDQDGSQAPVTLTTTPCSQSFCSEDIRITDICAFYAFSWIVAVTLESGAVVFVDAMSMDVLCCKPIARIAPIQRRARPSITPSHSSQFTLLQEKPLMLAAFDHNVATFCKSH